jgi:hypothetical protein
MRFRLPFLLSIILALGLAAGFVAVPWDEISSEGFPDRDNYVATIGVLAEDGAQPLQLEAASVVALLLNEYLWREILIAIANFSDEPTSGLLIASFVAAAIVTFFVLRRAGPLYAAIFLFCPLSIDLFMSQTRSGLALALFVCGLSVQRRWLRYVLMICSFFLHSVGALLFAIAVVHEFFLAQGRLGSRLKLQAAALMGAGVSVVWVFLSGSIFAAVGDRRADQGAMVPVSFTFALLWIAIAIIVVMFSRINTVPAAARSAMLTLTLLVTFAVATMLGVGALRFLALALPFVFVAIRSIREPMVRVGSLAGVLIFNFIHASLWMR